MKLYKLELVLFIVACCLLGYLLFFTKTDTSELDSLKDKIENTKKKADSLRKKLSTQEEAFKLKEQELNSKVKETEVYYKGELARINKKFDKERNRIKDLPLDEQVELLASNIGVIDSSPIIKVIDRDTTVVISPIQVVRINGVYVDNEELMSINCLMEANQDSLYKVVDDFRYLLSLRQKEITTYKELDSVSRVIIRGNEKTLLEQKKVAKKQKIKTAIISAAGGIILGALLIH